MCKAIDDMKKHSFEDGMNQGMETGRDLQLIELIMKKLSKQKTADVIADEVEEDISYVQKVCQIIQENPEIVSDTVCRILKNME